MPLKNKTIKIIGAVKRNVKRKYRLNGLLMGCTPRFISRTIIVEMTKPVNNVQNKTNNAIEYDPVNVSMAPNKS